MESEFAMGFSWELAEKALFLKICHPELVEGPLTILPQRASFEAIVRDPATCVCDKLKMIAFFSKLLEAVRKVGAGHAERFFSLGPGGAAQDRVVRAPCLLLQ